VQGQREVVRFLSAYQETWHRFFPDLHRRGQWHIVSHLCGRGREGAPVAELSGLVKQIFLLDDATVRERLGELYRLGFCTIEPADRAVSARTIVLPTPLLRAKFDGHLIEAAGPLLRAAHRIAPAQIDQETRRRLVRAVECCNEYWMASIEQTFEANGLSMARRLEARRHLLSPSHRTLILVALQRWYGMSVADEGEGVLADDMAAELLRLLRQNFQTTRDHIGYLMQLGLLERRTGRALRVALAEPVAAELDRAMTRATQELAQIAATFPAEETDMERTGISHVPVMPEYMDATNLAHMLIVTRAGEPERRVALGSKPLVIGRAPSNGLMLEANEVSRTHCSIILDNGMPQLTDLESTNGTFVDGKRITAPTSLPPGTVLQVGPYRLTYEYVPEEDVEGTMRTPGPLLDTARRRAPQPPERS